MIATDKYRHFCCEPLENVENYEVAVNAVEIYICHHRLGTEFTADELKAKDMYFNRPASELIFVSRAEHTSLHHSGKTVSDEQKAKQSAKMKNKPSWCAGQKLSESHKEHLRKPKKRSAEVIAANKERCKGKTWKLIDGKRVWLNK